MRVLSSGRLRYGSKAFSYRENEESVRNYFEVFTTSGPDFHRNFLPSFLHIS
jgi:hypothetical protein